MQQNLNVSLEKAELLKEDLPERLEEVVDVFQSNLEFGIAAQV